MAAWDDVYDSYFQNMSSASGDEAPQIPIGQVGPLGAFRPPDPLVPPRR